MSEKCNYCNDEIKEASQTKQDNIIYKMFINLSEFCRNRVHFITHQMCGKCAAEITYERDDHTGLILSIKMPEPKSTIEKYMDQTKSKEW